MADAGMESGDWAMPLDEDATRSHTIPAEYYYDPAMYRVDLDRIFYRTWQYVGYASQFANPGDYVATRLGEQSIVVLRDKAGKLRGFHNVCRHRAHELLAGEGTVTGSIVCPYHAWSYDLGGKLRAGPRLSRMNDFDIDKVCLQPVRVEEFGPFVFANIDLDAAPLAELAGDMLADMEERCGPLAGMAPRERFTFGSEGGMKANWKVVVDNYLECYHCRAAHPTFCELINMDRYGNDTFRYWSRQTGPDIRAENGAYPVDTSVPHQVSYSYFLWPNMTFNFFPGARGVLAISIQPLGVEEAVFTGHMLYPPEVGDDSRRLAWVQTPLAVEDQMLCESVQRGLKSSSYRQGRFVVTDAMAGEEEQALHHFHLLVKRACDGEGAYPG